MVYKIADNILSPLGATTAENYQAVKAGRSALARYDQRWSLPDKVLTASLKGAQDAIIEELRQKWQS